MQIEYRTEGAVGFVTLVNPPQNTLPHPRFADPGALGRFLQTPELKGVVLSGKGRHFCGGADLDSLRVLAQDPMRLQESLDEGKMLLDLIRFAPVPVVAAVRGSCLGAGLEIALACHFRVAATGAMLGFPEAEHGLIPGMSGTVEGAVGRATRIRMVLSGEMIGAEEARERGIIDTICPSPGVEEAAVDLIASLTGRRSSTLVHAAMNSMHNAVRCSRAEALAEESRLFCELVRNAPAQGET
jgi:enoyl-CoA hydratase/carnithine racemase